MPFRSCSAVIPSPLRPAPVSPFRLDFCYPAEEPSWFHQEGTVGVQCRTNKGTTDRRWHPSASSSLVYSPESFSGALPSTVFLPGTLLTTAPSAGNSSLWWPSIPHESGPVPWACIAFSERVFVCMLSRESFSLENEVEYIYVYSYIVRAVRLLVTTHLPRVSRLSSRRA